MRADSACQSETESWIIHRESIHRYRCPTSLVTEMACWNVLVRLLKGISLVVDVMLLVKSRVGGSLPQQ